jgi:diaminohydroxyphosphoribosylaminopyrimidine deaminase / 5-amino-6-(5-phosphoribosylamino)uracil reductase
MRRALELAARGEGLVEPNPMVGAVVVDGERRLLGEGFHERFGGPHAEINALRQAGDAARGATLFVTLEPCCHQGKTGPCVDAIIQSQIARVVVGTEDPNPQVAGEGIARLRAAGIAVETGLLRDECERLIAPFAKWITTGLPWVHAKWAMTLDGRIATRTGHSRWISSPASREVAHRLRGRMDAIVVGAETAARDDPLLTARPTGPRTAQRVVVSRYGRLNPKSQLAQTAAEVPVLVTALEETAVAAQDELQSLGVEVVRLPAADSWCTDFSRPVLASAGDVGTPDRLKSVHQRAPDLRELLRFLGSRNAANVLVEGGGRLLGNCFDAGLIDEFHVFVAQKLAGGDEAVSPLGGIGRERIPEMPDLVDATVEILDGDVYIHGRIK